MADHAGLGVDRISNPRGRHGSPGRPDPRGCRSQEVLPEGIVTVIDVKWHGTAVVELTYRDSAGRVGGELLHRDREPSLAVFTAGRPWSFDGDGALLRLASESLRIRMAHLFDPLLAIHTSLVDPLPHQITAVYGELLENASDPA
jgi:hypothetical protein